MKKVLALAAVAALGLAGVASAAHTPGQVTVPVKITMPAVVSIWTDDSEVQLSPNGASGFSGVERSFGTINNVVATVKASVSGVLPTVNADPNKFKFFIFWNQNLAGAQAAVTANNAAPAGAAVWANNTMAGDRTLATGMPIDMNGTYRPVVYATSTEGYLGTANEVKDLVVTFTIVTP